MLRADDACGTEPTPFGGQSALHSDEFSSPASAVPSGALSRRAVVALAAGVAGLAIAVLTAATALPKSTPAPAATAKPKPIPAAAHAQTTASIPATEAEPQTQRFTGRVGQDLSASLAAVGVPERQGREYVAILARAVPLASGLSVDDRYDLVVERAADGSFGRLLYVGLDRVARADVELLKWTDGKSVIWVNADGVGGEQSSRMTLPVHGRLTSGFGERFHPILGYRRFHDGLDLAARAGTPIVAAADGRVVSAGWHGGYGEQVEIAHAQGLETRYGHMSRIAARIGQVVRKGEVIGWVGSTGLSTGPHVHFEVMKGGRPVNPATVKMGAGPGQLEGEKLRQFQGELRGILLGSEKAS